jgi:DNA-binding HxlR family transcriptional regulator
MAAPRPGSRVRGSETGRPIMAILDHLGRRWALRIGWELRHGPLPFRELQRRSGMASPNVLAARLREGVELGILEQDPAGAYRLTPAGVRLARILDVLHDWADEWGRTLERGSRRRSPPGRSRRDAAR